MDGQAQEPQSDEAVSKERPVVEEVTLRVGAPGSGIGVHLHRRHCRVCARSVAAYRAVEER
jgi:hypothetical protein